MTGAREQKRRAIEGSYNPTMPALYEDPEVLAANPFFALLPGILSKAVARPSSATGRHYNRVSSTIWTGVHKILSGEATADEELGQLENRLRRIRRGDKW